jgi:hypothetical protein
MNVFLMYLSFQGFTLGAILPEGAIPDDILA